MVVTYSNSETTSAQGFYLKGNTSKSNASVRLYDSSNNLIGSTTSSGTGFYSISIGTTAGNYTVSASTNCVKGIYFHGSSSFYYSGTGNVWQDISMAKGGCAE